jgi:hypothetical protein
MISTSLKNQNNYIPSRIPDLSLDLYAEMSRQLDGSLVNANFQGVWAFGGLATTAATNQARPTYRANPPSVINNSRTAVAGTAMPSLGVVNFLNNAAPFHNQYDFTIFGVINVNATSHPGGAFMTLLNSSNSVWVCAGSNLPVLTNSTSALLSDTITTGLHVVTIQQNGANFSFRSDNSTTLSYGQRLFLGDVQFGVGRYNSSTLYSTLPNNFRRLIAYRRTLSTDEIIRVRNYLSAVYGTPTYA